MHLKQNMQLEALLHDGIANEDALQFPSYLLKLDEHKVQVEEKENVQNFTICEVLYRCFTFYKPRFSWNSVKLPETIAGEGNVLFLQLETSIWSRSTKVFGSIISDEERVFSSTDKVGNAEKKELRHSAELWSSIPGTTSMSDHHQILKAGFNVMLLCNLQPVIGRVSGARYVVEFLTNKMLFVRSVNETGNRKA